MSGSSGRVQGSTSLLDYSAGTTIGSCRVINEDAFAAFDHANTFVVVDGCGGASSGESAARVALECFRQVLQQQATSLDGLLLADPLAVAVLRANAEVFRAASAEPALRGQGAALCAVRVFEGWVTVVHVGDCRVGRFREDVFTWLTEDHSLLAELRRTDAPHEQLAEVEMFHANVITRAVGVGESLSADVGYHPASPGDIYLLCSDGLSRQVGVARIAEILREQSPDLPAGCSALLDATEDAGGHDNATVILLRLSASSLAADTDATVL